MDIILHAILYVLSILRGKGTDLTQYPTSTKNPKGNVTTQIRNQNFDYTMIAGRLRTVSRRVTMYCRYW